MVSFRQTGTRLSLVNTCLKSCLYHVINLVCSLFAAFLCKRVQQPSPLPNEDIDISNLESLEKYRSYGRYLRQALEEKNKPVWWKTYGGHVRAADPEHGEKQSWRRCKDGQTKISIGSLFKIVWSN